MKFTLFILTACFILCSLPLYSQETNAKVLTIGFSRSFFVDIDSREAKIAIELWCLEIVKNSELDLTPKVVIFNDVPSIIQAAPHY